MSIQRIILTTGGTGGHIFPAVAVAEEIRKRNPAAMILFVGSKHGAEADVAANVGLDYAGLPVKGIMGKGLKSFSGLFNMLRSIAKAIFIIRKVQPQIVVGFGGYAAFAATYAARFCKKPTAVHEQNSFPGMANRLLGKRSHKIFLSMPDTSGTFPVNKTTVTGNPVRAAIAALSVNFEERIAVKALQGNESKQYPSRLLVLGGSLGASAINKGMQRNITRLLEAGIEVWHQTGKYDAEAVRASYREIKAEHVRVEPFIVDIKRAYEWADVVLCRAGASTLAELTAVGLPAILVPLPHAAQDHQRHNARYFEQEGAGIILEQDRFASETSTDLADTILDLMGNEERVLAMSRISHLLGRPLAACAIVDELEKLVPGGGNSDRQGHV